MRENNTVLRKLERERRPSRFVDKVYPASRLAGLHFIPKLERAIKQARRGRGKILFGADKFHQP